MLKNRFASYWAIDFNKKTQLMDGMDDEYIHPIKHKYVESLEILKTLFFNSREYLLFQSCSSYKLSSYYVSLA